jgi:hypothetical protein
VTDEPVTVVLGRAEYDLVCALVRTRRTLLHRPPDPSHPVKQSADWRLTDSTLSQLQEPVDLDWHDVAGPGDLVPGKHLRQECAPDWCGEEPR